MSVTRPTIVVVGAGPAGLAAACLLAKAGVATSLIAKPTPVDPRTVALMGPSLRLLTYLNLWPGQLKAQSAPLKRQRLIDDTGALIVSPELLFDARELGLEAFGWNIPLRLLMEDLRAEAMNLNVNIIQSQAVDAVTGADHIALTLEDGALIKADLAIAADGANSLLRQRADITAEDWFYDQSALVTTFDHSAPHRDTSNEFHKAGGPCTTVPLPGKRSALVWMERPARAEYLAGLPPPELAREVQAAIHGELGLVSNCAPAKLFPMRGLAARHFANGRTILVGEAAHVVPPLGAQGLNMSLRDAALAAEQISEGISSSVSSIVTAYDSRRRQEVALRRQAVHAMNKSLLLGFLPLEWARSAALWGAYGLKPLRQHVMRYGLAEGGGLPQVMRSA